MRLLELRMLKFLIPITYGFMLILLSSCGSENQIITPSEGKATETWLSGVSAEGLDANYFDIINYAVFALIQLQEEQT